MAVSDADTDEAYGVLKDVLQTGANDVYVVETAAGKELLIPAIPDVIVEINLDENRMKIRPLEGLLDAN
jgi:16S rRNA processing protein RimM